MAYRFRVAILALLLGVSIAVIVSHPPSSILVVSVVGVGVAVLRKTLSLGLVLMSLSVGLFLGSNSLNAPQKILPPPTFATSVSGTVQSVSTFSSGVHRLEIAVERGAGVQRPQKVIVSTPYFFGLVGTQVRVRCKWEEPLTSRLESSAWQCFSREVTVIGYHAPGMIARTSEQIRSHLVSSTQQLMNEPESSILLGMVFGITGGIPREVANDFRATATAHLLVVSGMQFVILVGALERLLSGLTVRLYPRSLLILSALIVMLVVVGVSASTVRASLMALLPIISRILGRGRARFHTLLVVVGVMVIVFPAWISQLDFQLTVLATLGIMVASKLLTEIILSTGLPHRLSEAIATSTAATVFTLPVIATAFGAVGLWAIVPNVLLEFFVLLVLGSSIALLGVAAVSPAVAQLLSVIPTAFVWVSIGIVRVFAGVFAHPVFHQLWAISCSYAVATIALFILWRSSQASQHKVVPKYA